MTCTLLCGRPSFVVYWCQSLPSKLMRPAPSVPNQTVLALSTKENTDVFPWVTLGGYCVQFAPSNTFTPPPKEPNHFLPLWSTESESMNGCSRPSVLEVLT